MKGGLYFTSAVALIFLSAGVLVYSQSRTDDGHKKVTQTQERHIAHASKTSMSKNVSQYSSQTQTALKQSEKKTGGISDRKTIKDSAKKAVFTKKLKYHQIEHKKLQKKKSNNTPHNNKFTE